MTTHTNYRRIGWLAALSVCLVLYILLHLKVHSIHSEVVRAEREIVALEKQNMLLETEFLTRSNQVQLAKLNRINFGYSAPKAEQFIGGERDLAQFGSPRDSNAPEPIRLAGMTSEEGVPEFPQLVSPLTGQPVNAALVEPENDARNARRGGRITVSLTDNSQQVRVPLAVAAAGDLGQ